MFPIPNKHYDLLFRVIVSYVQIIAFYVLHSKDVHPPYRGRISSDWRTYIPDTEDIKQIWLICNYNQTIYGWRGGLFTLLSRICNEVGITI